MTMTTGSSRPQLLGLCAPVRGMASCKEEHSMPIMTMEEYGSRRNSRDSADSSLSVSQPRAAKPKRTANGQLHGGSNENSAAAGDIAIPKNSSSPAAAPEGNAEMVSALDSLKLQIEDSVRRIGAELKEEVVSLLRMHTILLTSNGAGKNAANFGTNDSNGSQSGGLSPLPQDEDKKSDKDEEEPGEADVILLAKRNVLVSRATSIKEKFVSISANSRALATADDDDRDEDDLDEVPPEPTLLEKVVEKMEVAVILLVVINAITIGWETDYTTEHDGKDLPTTFQVLEIVFCCLYTIELALRLWLQGRFFFRNAWNLFDFVIVGLQIIELIMTTFFEGVKTLNVSFLRSMRIVRVIRLTRMMESTDGWPELHFIEELRTLIFSIMGSLTSFCWTVILLSFFIYSMSVCFTQIVFEHKEAPHAQPYRKDLEYFYGSIGRTSLTLFECIAGGISWDEAVYPMILGIGPFMGFLFCLYVAFTGFAILNVVTGVFVEKATEKSQEDKIEFMENHLSQIFKSTDVDGSGLIDFSEFESRLDTKEMQDYFRALDVDLSEAKGIFQLLDADQSGTVDPVEFVSGCMRLQGPAKALETKLLMHLTAHLHEWTTTHIASLERRINWICQTLVAMNTGMGADAAKAISSETGLPCILTNEHLHTELTRFERETVQPTIKNTVRETVLEALKDFKGGMYEKFSAGADGNNNLEEKHSPEYSERDRQRNPRSELASARDTSRTSKEEVATSQSRGDSRELQRFQPQSERNSDSKLSLLGHVMRFEDEAMKTFSAGNKKSLYRRFADLE